MAGRLVSDLGLSDVSWLLDSVAGVELGFSRDEVRSPLLEQGVDMCIGPSDEGCEMQRSAPRQGHTGDETRESNATSRGWPTRRPRGTGLCSRSGDRAFDPVALTPAALGQERSRLEESDELSVPRRGRRAYLV
jgi:hypothetical protein